MDEFNQEIHNTSFTTELLHLKHEVQQSLSIKDYQDLKKIIWLNRIFLIIGYATAWIYINPISMVCISLALMGQWCIVAHHVCHGGYDKISPNNRYKSQNFAVGWRRYIDWFDWIHPAAWKYEHNILHHFYTNESRDPDAVFNQILINTHPKLPTISRYLFLIFSFMWKASYYSLNTLKAYDEKKQYNHNKNAFSFFKKAFVINYIPYISFHFIFLPLLFIPLGWTAVFYVLINRLGAELLTNIHTFFIIVPNHIDNNFPMQNTHFKNKDEFFLNQIKNSYNYKTGGFWRDYLQGYLNYQIEHHLFPNLPVSQYVKIQPKVKALCEKYGISYKEECLSKRIKKTIHFILHAGKINYSTRSQDRQDNNEPAP